MIRKRRDVAGGAQALERARWMCRDALSRKNPEAAAEILLGHAAAIAESSDPDERRLARWLEAGAADILAGRPPLAERA